MTRIALALMILALLAGCATTGGSEQAFNQIQREALSARADRIAAIADTRDCNGDPTCVVAAKGFAALVEAGSGAGEVRQYQHQPSTAARVGLALIGQLSPLASAAVAWRSSDNSVRTAEAQFGFLGGVVADVSNAAARSNEAAFGVLPGLAPSINVGRDYVTGQVGDTVGRDQIGRDQRVGDDVRRDTIGRDRTDWGSGNRFDSPGPWRDTGNGPRCEGAGCQPVNPLPEPEPDAGG